MNYEYFICFLHNGTFMRTTKTLNFEIDTVEKAAKLEKIVENDINNGKEASAWDKLLGSRETIILISFSLLKKNF